MAVRHQVYGQLMAKEGFLVAPKLVSAARETTPRDHSEFGLPFPTPISGSALCC